MKRDELTKILKRLYFEYVKNHINRIFVALSFSILVALSTSATAWLLDPAVKKIFIDQDSTYAWFIPIAIIVTFSSKGICLYFSRLNLIRVGAEVGGELQKKLANNIVTSDIQTLDNRHSGKYISNIMFDSHNVESLVSTGVLNLFKDSFSVIALVSVMFYQNWKLALIAIIMIPIAGLASKTLGKRIGKVATEAQEKSGFLNMHLIELFKNHKLIKIFQREDYESKRTDHHLNQLKEKNIKINTVFVRLSPIMETLTGIMIAILIFYSGKLALNNEIEIGNFFSFLAAMMLAYQPVRALSTMNMILKQGLSAANRILPIIDNQNKIADQKDSQNIKITNSNIKFNNINFKYNNDEKDVCDRPY